MKGVLLIAAGVAACLVVGLVWAAEYMWNEDYDEGSSTWARAYTSGWWYSGEGKIKNAHHFHDSGGSDHVRYWEHVPPEGGEYYYAYALTVTYPFPELELDAYAFCTIPFT